MRQRALFVVGGLIGFIVLFSVSFFSYRWIKDGKLFLLDKFFFGSVLGVDQKSKNAPDTDIDKWGVRFDPQGDLVFVMVGDKRYLSNVTGDVVGRLGKRVLIIKSGFGYVFLYIGNDVEALSNECLVKQIEKEIVSKQVVSFDECRTELNLGDKIKYGFVSGISNEIITSVFK